MGHPAAWYCDYYCYYYMNSHWAVNKLQNWLQESSDGSPEPHRATTEPSSSALSSWMRIICILGSALCQGHLLQQLCSWAVIIISPLQIQAFLSLPSKRWIFFFFFFTTTCPYLLKNKRLSRTDLMWFLALALRTQTLRRVQSLMPL